MRALHQSEPSVPGPLPGADARREQENLFDEPQKPFKHGTPSSAPVFRNRAPVAGNMDPLSSHLAGAAVTECGGRSNQKAALLAWLRGVREPLTSAEVAAIGGFDRHGTARRLPDLAEDGLVERCAMRVCCQTGHPSITWRVVDGNRAGTRTATSNKARTEAAPMSHEKREQLDATAATGSASVQQLAPERDRCARCDGAGIVLTGQNPDQYDWCDAAGGKACIHAESLRAANPGEVDRSSEASWKLHQRSLSAARGRR